MTHLGQRLSALIDGELAGSERERVLLHMARCGSCQDEVAALRTLKRRMNALGEAAAGAALTGKLMGLSESARAPMGEGPWPAPQTAGGWTVHGQHSKSEPRTGRYFLAGSLAVFLAGLGTAAFTVGGGGDAAPGPRITPPMEMYSVEHAITTGEVPFPGPTALPASAGPASSLSASSLPASAGPDSEASAP